MKNARVSSQRSAEDLTPSHSRVERVEGGVEKEGGG